jgi:gliding motility-associated-like protein
LKDPAAIATDLEEVCINKPATLTLDDVDARTVITWHDTNGNEIAGQNGLSFTIGEAGTYFATVSKSYCSFSTLPVQLAAVIDSMFVPNVFTANNDAVNDYFQIASKGIDNFELSLFNRHGQRMFETNDVNFKWSAENVSSGVYFWRISYTTCSNTRKEEKGWVHIIK